MILIVDANVLIDFVDADINMITHISKFVGPLFVADVVVDEVNGLNMETCHQHGLTIIETDEEAIAFASEYRGAPSFEDLVGLSLAKRNQWVMLSNDKTLRNMCKDHDVKVRWGLQILLDLLRKNIRFYDDSIAAAGKIHMNNPRHISREVLDIFISKANDIANDQ